MWASVKIRFLFLHAPLNLGILGKLHFEDKSHIGKTTAMSDLVLNVGGGGGGASNPTLYPKGRNKLQE